MDFLGRNKSIWDFVKDHIIDEKEQYKANALRGFGYSLFEEEEGGGTREVLYGHPHLKYLIQLWPGDLVKEISKMNEAIFMKNCVMVVG